MTDRQTDVAVIEKKWKKRESSIELLKVFAIFVIVVNHIVQTLTSGNPVNIAYVWNIAQATLDVSTIILVLLRHFGVWGNSIFFICSAWFLLRSQHCNKKKWLFMLIEIWSVSVIILAVTYFGLHIHISAKDIIKSFLPTTFSTNWYMTCYLLFYLVHPILNKVIGQMNQQQLFRSTAALTILYIGVNFIKSKLFFGSDLILWITIYFVIAYIQYYLKDFADSIKANACLFIFGGIGVICLTLVTEFAGVHISALSQKALHWALNNCNPFVIAMAIAFFNIARQIHFHNNAVNYLSSLTLLIYIIHENLILRAYIRPEIWNFIYQNYGYEHIFVWVFIFVAATFIFGVVIAMVYTAVLKNFILTFSDFLYEKLKWYYLYIESRILQLH